MSAGTSEFDAYADSYGEAVERSISFCDAGLEYFTRRKADHLLGVARRHLGDPRRLRALDVGCGVGVTDALLAGSFARLDGVDVASEAVERARERNPAVRYATYDGRQLPYSGESMDLVFAICVVHHVPRAERPTFAAELRRVLRPGGLAVLMEHNPLNPLTRLAVSRCEFDADAELLTRRATARLLASAGLTTVEQRYIVFFASPRPRALALEDRLGRIPAGAQHCVVARRA